jgi:hypothetical protein
VKCERARSALTNLMSGVDDGVRGNHFNSDDRQIENACIQ